MRLQELSSLPNLELAWRRITTGGNNQYKTHFRSLYHSYELALRANLLDLQKRLRGGSYVPRSPSRVYLPKASGLHRPLSLMCLEDQIVLPAFANLAAAKMHAKRSPFQLTSVYSNILEQPDSIFFFRRWQDTYEAFQRRIKRHYRSGLRWVADFDLAAFYDTISHELLVRTIYPRAQNPDLDWIRHCLQVWSSDASVSGHGHGLPQGPIASDLLAECFLLPIDSALRERVGYLRYVDDVRILGPNEEEVRASVIELERQCRSRGLIPQVGKFAVKRVRTLSDALGMLPSVADPHHAGDSSDRMEGPAAVRMIRVAVTGRPQMVTDKTRLRFALFRAAPNTELLGLCVRLIPRHPEHTDAFFAYISQFGYRRPVERLCTDLLARNPYGMVRGEAWHVLARYCRDYPASMSADVDGLRVSATAALSRSGSDLSERWGAAHFLCASGPVPEPKSQQRLISRQDPTLQSLLAPALTDRAFSPDGLVRNYLLSAVPEPGLSVCAAIQERGLNLSTFGLTPDQVHTQVANTLRELGVLPGRTSSIDPVSELLKSRYGVQKGGSWRNRLGAEYSHALGVLKQAEAAFDASPSYWLACQNSFNQVLFLSLQRHLAISTHPAVCTIIDKHGRLVDYGVTLDGSNSFARVCPDIADCLRDMNNRRNRLPASHPYEKKTAAQSQLLVKSERNHFVARLGPVYADIQAMYV